MAGMKNADDHRYTCPNGRAGWLLLRAVTACGEAGRACLEDARAMAGEGDGSAGRRRAIAEAVSFFNLSANLVAALAKLAPRPSVVTVEVWRNGILTKRRTTPTPPPGFFGSNTGTFTDADSCSLEGRGGWRSVASNECGPAENTRCATRKHEPPPSWAVCENAARGTHADKTRSPSSARARPQYMPRTQGAGRHTGAETAFRAWSYRDAGAICSGNANAPSASRTMGVCQRTAAMASGA